MKCKQTIFWTKNGKSGQNTLLNYYISQNLWNGRAQQQCIKVMVTMKLPKALSE